MTQKIQRGAAWGAGYLDRLVEVQYQALRNDINEIRKRVERLEAVLGRGTLLLVGNLVGVLITLLYQLI